MFHLKNYSFKESFNYYFNNNCKNIFIGVHHISVNNVILALKLEIVFCERDCKGIRLRVVTSDSLFFLLKYIVFIPTFHRVFLFFS